MLVLFSLLSHLYNPMPPSSSSLSSTKPRKPNNNNNTHSPNHHHNSPPLLCRHHTTTATATATATLDLLMLILVLISGAFLLSSYLSYLFHSLSLLVPPSLSVLPLAIAPAYAPFLAALILSFSAALAAFLRLRSRRRCSNPKCKGLSKALEFDLQVQVEDAVRSGCPVIDRLPWKGGTENNPDYECLRAELRKMAPPNGRAVLLFRAKCGCPVAKLVGWGRKKGRKHKKCLANVAANGDHR